MTVAFTNLWKEPTRKKTPLYIILFTFYSSKNSEKMYMVFTKILRNITAFNIGVWSNGCWKFWHHRNKPSLWRRFSSRISLYLAAFIFPSIATSRPVPAAEKHPHSMMLPPPCFTVGTVLDRWWAVPGFLHTYRLELRPKSYILVSSDQRILQVFFSKLHAGFHVSCTEERLPSGHSAIKPRLVEGCSDGWLSTTFSHLPNASLELSHVIFGFFFTSLTKALLPR